MYGDISQIPEGCVFSKTFVNGSFLNNVEKETYLGFIMNSCDKEDDRPTICKETRALYARGNMLLSKFGHCTVDVKKNLFMTYCSSLYCCSLWSAYDYTTLRSIHVAHNVFRRFVSCTSVCESA